MADDDPVTAEYDVFITPSLAEHMYLLQYPIRNRAQPYNDRNQARPTEMRLKPDSGYVELDVTMSTSHNFNKYKGLMWGEAMRKAQTSGVTTFGAAAGFGPGAMRGGRGRGGGDNEPSIDANLNKFKDAVNKNYVYAKQTLGGQILKDEIGKPNYMLGTFRGKELHLTRVDGIVQMRPQFHHVDATAHLEKAGNQREPDESRPPPQARGLVQSYKDQRDVEDVSTLRAKNLMQMALEESWTKMKYYDEDEAEAYDAYHEKLFVHNTDDAPKLKSSMTNVEYLEAISAPRNDPSGKRRKPPMTKKQRAAIEVAEVADEEAEREAEEQPEQPRHNEDQDEAQEANEEA